MIAGHSFIETPNGRVCSGCGRRWVDITDVLESDIEKSTWHPHSGTLNRDEYNEIRAAIEAQWLAGKGA